MKRKKRYSKPAKWFKIVKTSGYDYIFKYTTPRKNSSNNNNSYIENAMMFDSSEIIRKVIWKLKKKLKANFIADGID